MLGFAQTLTSFLLTHFMGYYLKKALREIVVLFLNQVAALYSLL